MTVIIEEFIRRFHITYITIKFMKISTLDYWEIEIKQKKLTLCKSLTNTKSVN